MSSLQCFRIHSKFGDVCPAPTLSRSTGSSSSDSRQHMAANSRQHIARNESATHMGTRCGTLRPFARLYSAASAIDAGRRARSGRRAQARASQLAITSAPHGCFTLYSIDVHRPHTTGVGRRRQPSRGRTGRTHRVSHRTVSCVETRSRTQSHGLSPWTVSHFYDS